MFAVAVVVIGAVVALLITRNDNSSKRSCVSHTVSVASDSDRTAEEALATFVAEQEEGPLPLNGKWTKTSDTPDGTVFSTDVSGHWDVTVRNGQVRSYSGCPA